MNLQAYLKWQEEISATRTPEQLDALDERVKREIPASDEDQQSLFEQIEFIRSNWEEIHPRG